MSGRNNVNLSVLFTAGFGFLVLLCYGSVSHAQFPCDLEELQRTGVLPQLILSGESHSNFYSKVDEQVHRDFAKQEQFILASEGLLFGEVRESAFGIEEPFSYALGTVIKYFVLAHAHYQSLRHGPLTDAEVEAHQEGLQKILISSFEWIAKNALIWPIWKRTWTQKVYDDEVQAVISVLDLYLKDQVIGSVYLEEVVKSLSLVNKSSVYWQVISRFSEAIFSDFNEKFTGELRGIQLASFDPRKIHTETGQANFAYIDSYLVELRNRTMGKNIAKLYCSAVQKRIPLFVIIGTTHIEGLSLFLSEQSHNLIPIEIRNSASGVERLLNSETEEETMEVLLRYFPVLFPRENFSQILQNIEETAHLFHSHQIQLGLEGAPLHLSSIHKPSLQSGKKATRKCSKLCTIL